MNPTQSMSSMGVSPCAGGEDDEVDAGMHAAGFPASGVNL